MPSCTSPGINQPPVPDREVASGTEARMAFPYAALPRRLSAGREHDAELLLDIREEIQLTGYSSWSLLRSRVLDAGCARVSPTSR
jgi:hypothetical protein